MRFYFLKKITVEMCAPLLLSDKLLRLHCGISKKRKRVGAMVAGGVRSEGQTSRSGAWFSRPKLDVDTSLSSGRGPGSRGHSSRGLCGTRVSVHEKVCCGAVFFFFCLHFFVSAHSACGMLIVCFVSLVGNVGVEACCSWLLLQPHECVRRTKTPTRNYQEANNALLM